MSVTTRLSKTGPLLQSKTIAKRFRGFYPVVVDVETGGLDPERDALLEIAAIPLVMNNNGLIYKSEPKHYHVVPAAGLRISEESLLINQIDPHHPFRFAVTEHDALSDLFEFLCNIKDAASCKRCVLVGHNAWFDLQFINNATKRAGLKSPFHSFTSFDTATLAAAVYGQTALARAAKRAQIDFDQNQYHSAIYDAEKTAELFCKMINYIGGVGSNLH